MTIKRLSLIVLISFLNISCARVTLQLESNAEPTNWKDIAIYYPIRPKCNFETLGLIQVSGGYYSLHALFDRMRSEAAAIGAEAIYVVQTQRLDIKDYLGTAKAIRCLAA